MEDKRQVGRFPLRGVKSEAGLPCSESEQVERRAVILETHMYLVVPC